MSVDRARFTVRVASLQTLHELPDAWTLADYRALLEALELEDIAGIDDGELREMCLMALSDLEPEDAASVVLRHRLGGKLREGQIHDVSHDILDEPLWEDYPDMTCHEHLYCVNQLLYDAFNGRFPRPRAVRVTIEVEAEEADGRRMLESPTEALLVRLVAAGLGEDALVHRLFDDKLAGSSFPEAASIVWQFEHRRGSDDVVGIVMVGSAYWLEALRHADRFHAVAHEDAAPSVDK